jgi:hypothetical protein
MQEVTEAWELLKPENRPAYDRAGGLSGPPELAPMRDPPPTLVWTISLEQQAAGGAIPVNEPSMGVAVSFDMRPGATLPETRTFAASSGAPRGAVVTLRLESEEERQIRKPGALSFTSINLEKGFGSVKERVTRHRHVHESLRCLAGVRRAEDSTRGLNERDRTLHLSKQHLERAQAHGNNTTGFDLHLVLPVSPQNALFGDYRKTIPLPDGSVSTARLCSCNARACGRCRGA